MPAGNFLRVTGDQFGVHKILIIAFCSTKSLNKETLIITLN